jgi:uncharacterized membrane protein
MVTMLNKDDGNARGLVIRPNAAPSLRAVVGGYLVMSVPVMLQGIVLTLIGLWPTLFYALATVIALGVSMHIGYRYTQQREVVVVDGEQLAVEKGHRNLEQRVEFPRGWAQVVITEEPHFAGIVSHLFIRSHGQQVEVGRFLDDRERRELAARLRPLIASDA